MRFKIWLEQSISDFLSKTDSKLIKNAVREFLSNKLNGRDLDVATNMFAYIFINENLLPNTEKITIFKLTEKIWEELKDFLIPNLSIKRNIFVNPISLKELQNLNIKYHRDLTIGKNLRKGPQGLPVVDVKQKLEELKEDFGMQDLPDIFEPSNWSGWNWVSLGCGYSREEGAAGGHCGNIGTRKGDNIFSLRDPSGRVLLTFIVNTITGTLGEAKGINNKKPTKEFHPPIVALIISDYVRNYSKSSHENEEEGIGDFHPDDMKYLPDLYEIVKNHLSGKKDYHEVPKNYLPLKWVEQWDDKKLDQLSDDQKLNVFIEIIKVLLNYKPLEYNPYDKEDKHEDININFSFKKITESVFKKIKSPKQAVFIFEIIGNLYHENKLERYEDMEYFKPDVFNNLKSTVSGGLDDFSKYFSWSNVKAKKLRKKDQIDIDDDLLSMVANHIDSLQLSNREKADFINTLEDAGYREEYDLEDDKGMFLKKNNKSSNIFEELINKNVDSLIKDRVDGKELPDNSYLPILQKVRSNLVSKYSSAVSSDPFIPAVVTQINAKINDSFKNFELVDLWIKKNILKEDSSIVSISFNHPKLENKELENYLSDKSFWRFSGLNQYKVYQCVSEMYEKEFLKEIKKIARSLNLGYEKSQYSLNFSVRVKSKQFFKNYLLSRNPFNYDLINKTKKTLQNLLNKKYTLEKFIERHFEEIGKCIKQRIDRKYSYRKHEKKKFREWLRGRDGI